MSHIHNEILTLPYVNTKRMDKTCFGCQRIITKKDTHADTYIHQRKERLFHSYECYQSLHRSYNETLAKQGLGPLGFQGPKCPRYIPPK